MIAFSTNIQTLQNRYTMAKFNKEKNPHILFFYFTIPYITKSKVLTCFHGHAIRDVLPFQALQSPKYLLQGPRICNKSFVTQRHNKLLVDRPPYKPVIICPPEGSPVLVMTRKSAHYGQFLIICQNTTKQDFGKQHLQHKTYGHYSIKRIKINQNPIHCLSRLAI